MIEERGCVTSVEPGFVWVTCARQAGCERCAAGKGCGGGLLSRLLGDRLHRVRAISNAPVSTGQQVVIGLDESVLIRSAMMVYGVPIVGVILGALFAWLAAPDAPEWVTIGGGVVGLTAGFLVTRQFENRFKKRRRFQPIVLRRLTGEAG